MDNDIYKFLFDINEAIDSALATGSMKSVKVVINRV